MSLLLSSSWKSVRAVSTLLHYNPMSWREGKRGKGKLKWFFCKLWNYVVILSTLWCSTLVLRERNKAWTWNVKMWAPVCPFCDYWRFSLNKLKWRISILDYYEFGAIVKCQLGYFLISMMFNCKVVFC